MIYSGHKLITLVVTSLEVDYYISEIPAWSNVGTSH